MTMKPEALDAAGRTASGMPVWLFWLLLGIIVFLIVVILVRDRGIRVMILRLFASVGKKIRASRIHRRIRQLDLQREEWLIGLGKQFWDAGGVKDVDAALAQDITALEEDEQKSRALLTDLLARLETIEKRWAETEEKQQARLAELQENRRTLKREQQEAGSSLQALRGSLQRLEKQQRELNSRLESQRAEQLRLENDKALSRLDRKVKQNEIDRIIQRLHKRAADIGKDVNRLRENLESGKTRHDRKADRWAGVDAQWDEWKTAMKDARKKHDSEADKLRDRIKSVKLKIHVVEKQLATALAQVGALVLDQTQLADRFAEPVRRLNRIETQIRDLQEVIDRS